MFPEIIQNHTRNLTGAEREVLIFVSHYMSGLVSITRC